MPIISIFLAAAFLPAVTTCQQTSTAAGVVGLLIFLGLVAGVIVLAVLNSTARGRLAAANAELNHLRPEYARLHQWIAGSRASTESPASPAQRPDRPTAPPQWSPDPSGRHQLRYWDGTSWSHHVADGGLTGTDPAE
ncbi:MAG: DUF2510 domain-containing protein [Acidimicrobiales bacterium]